ncbi:hypothetical protein LXL04_024524 [Taraxacum kok-saghyz]
MKAAGSQIEINPPDNPLALETAKSNAKFPHKLLSSKRLTDVTLDSCIARNATPCPLHKLATLLLLTTSRTPHIRDLPVWFDRGGENGGILGKGVDDRWKGKIGLVVWRRRFTNYLEFKFTRSVSVPPHPHAPRCPEFEPAQGADLPPAFQHSVFHRGASRLVTGPRTQAAAGEKSLTSAPARSRTPDLRPHVDYKPDASSQLSWGMVIRISRFGSDENDLFGEKKRRDLNAGVKGDGPEIGAFDLNRLGKDADVIQGSHSSIPPRPLFFH